MSQKELLEAISQQAHLQSDKIVTEARETVVVILRKAEAELGKVKEGVIEQARASMKNEEARIINEARLQTKKEMLGTKHELVSRVMKGLEEKILELSKRKDYAGIVASLLDECLERAGTVTVRCRAQDRKPVEEHLRKAGVTAVIQETPFRLGGVEVFWGARGEFVRRNTFESRLEKIYPDLLREAESLIFSGGAA